MTPAEESKSSASPSAPRVAVVTGATGFIGSTVCRVLYEAGIEVRGIGRRQTGMLPHGATYCRADVLERSTLRPALRGADTLVHLAARVHVMRESASDALQEFRRVNVDGTRMLLEEAVGAGIDRLIFASTVKAVAEASDSPLTEETLPRPVDAYGVSKLEAEELVRELADRSSLEATILRLPLVYGPGMKGNMLTLFNAVARGIPLPLELVRNRRSLVFLGNVAAAILALLRSPGRSAGTFFVSDGHDLSTPELVRLIADALGREPRLWPVPPPLIRAAGTLGDRVSRFLPVPLTSAAVDRLLGSLMVDASALTRAIAFRPPYSVQQGLRETADWYLGLRGARL